MSLPLYSYPLFFLTGIVAGLVDSMAGGGGIISLPVLLNFNLPIPVALGTNKLQASMGSVAASWHYVGHGMVRLRDCRLGIAATLLGSAAGAFAVQQLSHRFLEAAIPWLLGAIVLYSILRPRVGEHDHPPRLGFGLFFCLFGLGLGFYDGFFGPGTGSFWTIALVAVMGFNFMKATGYTKVMNATSNVAALALFAAGGKIDVAAGLAMGCGQLIGAKLGSGLVIRNGARFVRPVFLTMVTLTMARLIYLRVTAPG